MRSSTLVLWLSLLGPAAAHAQAPALRPGALVRFWLVDDGMREDVAATRFMGHVVAVGRDSIQVRIHQQLAPVSIPVRLLDRLEVNQGHESALQGAWRASRVVMVIGLVAGAAIGSEVANATGQSGGKYFETVASRAAIYGGTIAATAAIWGALHPAERWVSVAPVAASAFGGGVVGVRLAMRF